VVLESALSRYPAAVERLEEVLVVVEWLGSRLVQSLHRIWAEAQVGVQVRVLDHVLPGSAQLIAGLSQNPQELVTRGSLCLRSAISG